MFKKEPRVKALSNLKNSERKKLQTRVQSQFNASNFRFESNVIKQTNFVSTVSQGTIYTNDNGNIPIFFKEKHNDTIYPTVFTCWNEPTLLPIILTHSVVIEDHIFNGANLMISGTLPPFNAALKQGVICGIANYKSPNIIIAVGVVEMGDLTEFNSTGVIGKTGVAVKVMHHVEDGLFKEFKVKIDIPESIAVAGSEEPEVIEDKDSFDEIEKVVPEPASSTNVSVEDVAEVLDKLSVDDVDYFMTRALYYTIKQDESLTTPITASNFMSAHLIKNLPHNLNHNEVNVKKSSWKKTAKYLKHFEKEGFLKLKGKGDDLVITQLIKDKDELKNFVPYKLGAGSGSDSKAATPSNKSKSSFTIETLYKPSSAMKAFMSQQLIEIYANDSVKSKEFAMKQYYNVSDIKDVVNFYIKAQLLVNPKNPKTIMLDDKLFGMVNKSVNKPKFERITPRAQILDPIVANNFNELYKIYDSNGEPLFKQPRRGTVPHINIVTEMKIGRKIVTRVNNFEVFNIDCDGFASELRKLCSGSTTLSETQQYGIEVQVQGPHGPTIIAYLNDKVGIPSKWIEFENKIKKKKKRN